MYNNSFSEFLRKRDLEDKWRDFRESCLTVQNQFLEKMSLSEEFQAYQNEKIVERKKNSNESVNDENE